ncbi:hypothetical protein ACSS7Z_06575 [Microbacterium sp. A82]|uniref:hypothetical protein n=1 Tax=Microbacterium sp. A82 TaxID=3450452 RepID=UPI003F33B133
MNRRAPLPDRLQNRAFSTADARSEGVSASRLRAQDLSTPTRGVRTALIIKPPVADAETTAQRLQRLDTEMLERAGKFALALTPDQFFSHETGLGLISVPLPYTRAEERSLHVSARRPAGQPRRHGVIGHRLQQRAPNRWMVDDVPIEHPARMWRQAAMNWSVDDVIVAADNLILPRRRLLSIHDLRQEIAEAGDLPGGRLARALDAARAGAETAEETRLRLLLMRAGLPEPELNLDIFDAGRFVARLDLAFPRYRVAVEHDGRVHAENNAQFAKDADRWDAIRASGWDHVRVLSHHMRPDPQIAIDKAARALFNAGWRPGRA